eukprot:TRINITY_DN21422_c0_g1_i3.p1 TRINITY_DN21422_c0_g1~~TRINITY_DN21422_c0_g1_i3.p1  ORF type:complete len:512 (-),score=140.28 TRINITY_DN21422_c0_g1_i3:71-1606(-)
MCIRDSSASMTTARNLFNSITTTNLESLVLQVSRVDPNVDGTKFQFFRSQRLHLSRCPGEVLRQVEIPVGSPRPDFPQSSQSPSQICVVYTRGGDTHTLEYAPADPAACTIRDLAARIAWDLGCLPNELQLRNRDSDRINTPAHLALTLEQAGLSRPGVSLKAVTRRHANLSFVPDEPVLTPIDINSVLMEHARANDHLVVCIGNGTIHAGADSEDFDAPSIVVWFQATSMTVSLLSDSDKTIVMASSKEAPYGAVAGVQILPPAECKLEPAVTDEHGTAVIAHRKPPEQTVWKSDLRVQTVHPVTGEILELPNSGLDWNYVRDEVPEYRWVVFDDRKMYKPSETAYFKGFLREIGEHGQLVLPSSTANPLTLKWEVVGKHAEVLAEGKLGLNARGEFDFSLVLPPKKVGKMSLRIELEEQSSCTSHEFEVKEFKTPEFIATAVLTEPAKRNIVGDDIEIRSTGSYYSGGVLAEAKALYTVCLLYTSDAADEEDSVDLGGRRIIKKKKKKK